jgi:putative transposase
MSFRFTVRVADAGIDASIGTVGDALDNALMESPIGLYETELIKPRRPWKSLSDVELATAEWTDWSPTIDCTPRSGTCPQPNTNRCSALTPTPASLRWEQSKTSTRVGAVHSPES